MLKLKLQYFGHLMRRTAAAAAAKLLQSCPTLCDPIDGSPPGSPVPGILQARVLEWGAIAFSGEELTHGKDSDAGNDYSILLNEVSTYLKTCSTSFPGAHTASLSTLNSIQGVLKVSCYRSTRFNIDKRRRQIPLASANL